MKKRSDIVTPRTIKRVQNLIPGMVRDHSSRAKGLQIGFQCIPAPLPWRGHSWKMASRSGCALSMDLRYIKQLKKHLPHPKSAKPDVKIVSTIANQGSEEPKNPLRSPTKSVLPWHELHGNSTEFGARLDVNEGERLSLSYPACSLNTPGNSCQSCSARANLCCTLICRYPSCCSGSIVPMTDAILSCISADCKLSWVADISCCLRSTHVKASMSSSWMLLCEFWSTLRANLCVASSLWHPCGSTTSS